MKMLKEHYAVLDVEIRKVLAKYNMQSIVREYEHGHFSRSDKVKDLQKRFCFDLFFAAGLSKFASDNLYTYLDDINIFTALKAICPNVTKRY